MNTLFFHPVGPGKDAPSRGQHGLLKLTPSKIGRVPGKGRVEGAGSHLKVNSITGASTDGVQTLTHSQSILVTHGSTRSITWKPRMAAMYFLGYRCVSLFRAWGEVGCPKYSSSEYSTWEMMMSRDTVKLPKNVNFKPLGQFYQTPKTP